MGLQERNPFNLLRNDYPDSYVRKLSLVGLSQFQKRHKIPK